MRPVRPALLLLAFVLVIAAASCARAITPVSAPDSITVAELREHVTTLADDVFEGRGVGTRGGRAAGQYIVQHLRQTQLAPAGTEDGYFQPTEQGGRNILAMLPGGDPALRNEYIVVGAHYDHVGDGRQGRAGGPIGVIYNGADDNASGVAALLETIESLATRAFLRAAPCCSPFGMAKRWASSVPTIG
jgi:hypothetical protein